MEVSTSYKKEYYYEIADTTLSPPTLVLRALSIRELNLVRGFGKSQNTAKLIAIKKSLITTLNIEGATSIDDVLNSLSQEQIEEIYSFIISSSVYTEALHKTTSLSIKLAMDEKFQTDTWDCDMCRHKGLDTQRNCRFREDFEELYLPAFQVLVDGEVYKDCPMYYKDSVITRDAFMCYSAYDKGVLPDSGGLYDQTEFFVNASSLVRDYRAKLEREAMEKGK